MNEVTSLPHQSTEGRYYHLLNILRRRVHRRRNHDRRRASVLAWDGTCKTYLATDKRTIVNNKWKKKVYYMIE